MRSALPTGVPVSAWQEGIGHLQAGQFAQARACFKALLKAHPDKPRSWLMMARLDEEQALWGPAAVHYQKALMATQGKTIEIVLVHQQMGLFRLARGDAPRALESFRQALAVQKNLGEGAPEALTQELRLSAGQTLLRLGMREEGMRMLTRVAQSEDLAMLTRLAQTLFENNAWEDALQVLRQALAFHPNDNTAIYNLAHLLAECWQMDEALALLDQAEKQGPLPGAAEIRAMSANRMGQVEQALPYLLAQAQKPEALPGDISAALMSALYSDRLSAREVLRWHQDLTQKWGRDARSRQGFKRDLNSNRRLRIGYLSPDFHRQHPVNIFMQPLLAMHDRGQFEIRIYATGFTVDEQTLSAQTRVDHWMEASGWSDERLAAQIMADELDVLVDLSGHTAKNKWPLLANRLAPVQLSYLGYPSTTGLTQMDGLIADAVVVPEQYEHLYSERIYRLKGSVFCFAPEQNYPSPGFESHRLQKPTEPLIFGSFNNIPKLSPRTLKLWSEVLMATPHSRLVLKAPSFKDPQVVRALRETLVSLGVSADRLEFRGPVGLDEMMAEYADIDIALDPSPYNGGTTSLQAMWMGVPLITLCGESFVQRMGASFMTRVGLGEWVAHDDAEYVQKATEMAADRSRLLQLKAGLRPLMVDSGLSDIKLYARDLEQIFRQAWQDFARVAVI